MKARKKRQCIVVNVVNKDRKMKEKREAKEIDKAIEDDFMSNTGLKKDRI